MGVRKLMRDTSKVAEEWRENDRRKNAPLVHDENISKIVDIPYDEYDLLDIYCPKGKEKVVLPVIVIIHGGGYFYGDKELYSFYGEALAKRDFRVILFNYQLTPHKKFPFQLNQINNVMKFIVDNKDKYYLDANNVFAIGDSAGGQLALHYTCAYNSPVLANKLGFEVPKGFILRGSAVNCGIYYLHELVGDSEFMAFNYIGDIDASKDERFIYSNYFNKDFTPLFIGDGNKDWCIKFYFELVEEAKKCHVPFVNKLYGDEITDTNHVFFLQYTHPYANQCNDDECNFFKSLIK